MSSVRGSAGSPWTVISRYVAFSFDLHSDVSNPGTLTKGVSTFRSGVTHGAGLLLPTIDVPSVDRYAWSVPLPPPSAAGFVHAATMSGVVTRPNSVFAGGGIVERNDAYVMTQPVCVAERHSGTCWNDPPTSLPLGTEIVVPSRIAETIRDWMGLPSISCRISSVAMNDPCECATITKPRPRFSCST